MKYNIFLVVLMVSLFSCKSGLKATKENIAGRWNVVHAQRDGVPTKTLESAFFEFTKDGLVTSNLLPSSEPTQYSLESNILKIESEIPVSFSILEMQNDTLNIEGLMGNYRVELTMAR